MKVFRNILAICFCSLIIIMLHTVAFASQNKAITEENANYNGMREEKIKSISAYEENSGEQITLKQGDEWVTMTLNLNSYVGSTKNFFVLTQGKDINENTEIQLQLLDKDSDIWGEWTISCNEYRMWNLNLPPAGKWVLRCRALNFEPKDEVTVFARWQ